MATAYPVKINGTTIKTPSSFKFARYNITKSGRVSNGDMHMEFKSKKKKMFLSYDVISGRDLDTILALVDTTSMFFSVTYYDHLNVARTITCYVGEITEELQRRGTIGDNSYYKDLVLDFIQQ